MKSSSIGTVFIRTFIFFLGLMFIFPALNKLYIYFDYRYLGSSTYGTIDHPSSGRDLGGRPIIQYQDSKGTIHEFKSKAKTHLFYSPEKGEKIKIFITGVIHKE